MNTPNFPENCMKSKEFGRPGGGVRPSRPPLDPPMPRYLTTVLRYHSVVNLKLSALNSTLYLLVTDITITDSVNCVN